MVVLGLCFQRRGDPCYKGWSHFHACSISHSHNMNNCAIGRDGKLLDAAEIQWFHDADDAHPLPPTTSEVLQIAARKFCRGSCSVVGRTSCTILEFISFSTRHTLHTRCAFITYLQILFWCFQRLRSSCRVYFFRSPWHYLVATCKPQAWDHSHPHVGQTASVSCSRSHLGHFRWLVQIQYNFIWSYI